MTVPRSDSPEALIASLRAEARRLRARAHELRQEVAQGDILAADEHVCLRVSSFGSLTGVGFVSNCESLGSSRLTASFSRVYQGASEFLRRGEDARQSQGVRVTSERNPDDPHFQFPITPVSGNQLLLPVTAPPAALSWLENVRQDRPPAARRMPPSSAEIDARIQRVMRDSESLSTQMRDVIGRAESKYLVIEVELLGQLVAASFTADAVDLSADALAQEVADQYRAALTDAGTRARQVCGLDFPETPTNGY